MTPGNQRIAIAEACGEWSWWLWGRDQFVITAPRNIRLTWSGEDKATNSMRCPLNGQSLDEAARDLMLRIIPDFLNDLNAMRESLLAQSPKFRLDFDVQLKMRADFQRKCICELTAKDWADCFISVLQSQRDSLKVNA